MISTCISKINITQKFNLSDRDSICSFNFTKEILVLPRENFKFSEKFSFFFLSDTSTLHFTWCLWNFHRYVISLKSQSMLAYDRTLSIIPIMYAVNPIRVVYKRYRGVQEIRSIHRAGTAELVWYKIYRPEAGKACSRLTCTEISTAVIVMSYKVIPYILLLIITSLIIRLKLRLYFPQ